MMTKQEMIEGFKRGRILIQEEWSDLGEIRAADECIDEGHAVILEHWQWHDSYQCSYRKLKGTMK